MLPFPLPIDVPASAPPLSNAQYLSLFHISPGCAAPIGATQLAGAALANQQHLQSFIWQVCEASPITVYAPVEFPLEGDHVGSFSGPSSDSKYWKNSAACGVTSSSIAASVAHSEYCQTSLPMDL